MTIFRKKQWGKVEYKKTLRGKPVLADSSTNKLMIYLSMSVSIYLNYNLGSFVAEPLLFALW